MKFPSWLRNPIARARTNSRKCSLLCRKAHAPRLMIEPLEERVLLANVYWNLDESGSWDTDSNWSTGSVPGAADDVFLDRPAGNFTITHDAGNFAVNSIHASKDALVVTAGTLTIAATSELGDFSFASLILNGSLTTSGAVNWSAGLISSPYDPNGDPINTFTNTGTMTLAGPGDSSLAAGLVNGGTILHAGLGNLFAGYGGILTNQVGAVYEFQGNQSVLEGGGTFINRGTLRKSAGVGTSTISAPVNNTGGTLDVQSGILALTDGGALASGVFSVAAGSFLDLSSIAYSGTFTGSGSGLVRLFTGLSLGPTGATFNFNGQWVSGAWLLGDTGLTNLGTLTIDGADSKAFSGVFTNAGTFLHRATGDLRIGYEDSGFIPHPGMLNNASGGLYDLQGDANFTTFAAPSSVNNAGIIRKSAGAGVSATLNGLDFHNTGGTIDVRSGTFILAGGSHTGGTFNAAAGASLKLTGDQTLTGAYTGSGAGTVERAAQFLTVGPAGANFNFSAGLFQWTGGVIDGGAAGLTNLGSITLAGPSDKSLAHVINNAGTIVHTGTGVLANYDHGTLNNLAGAVYDIQADVNVTIDTLINRGTLRKSGGAGTSSMRPATFSNAAAAVDVLTGTLELASSGGASTGGTFTVAAGAVLDLTGGHVVHYTGNYTGSGQGTVRVGSGGIVVDEAGATFNFPARMFQWTGGEIDGGSTGLNNVGAITLAGPDVKALSGVLNNAGTITHTGAGDLQLDPLPFGSGGAATLNNLAGGLYDLQGDQNFTQQFSDHPLFLNAGTLRKSAGTGVSTAKQEVVFQNLGGTIDVQTGTFSMRGLANDPFAAAGAHTGGTFRVAKDALLDLTGGPFQTAVFAGSYSGSGAGIVELGAGTLVVGAGGATFNFPPGLFQWTDGIIDANTAPLTNRGTITLPESLQPVLSGALNNAGTVIMVGEADLFLVRSGFTQVGMLTNLAEGLFEFQGDGGRVNPVGAESTSAPGSFINQGTVRKSSGPGTATIGTAVFDNTGTVAVDAGTVQIKTATVTQVSAGTLTAGTWQISAASSIDLAGATAITTNNAHVILDGPGSSFAKLDTLAGNSGGFSLLNGRSFTTAGALTNTGSLTVGAGSTLSVTGTYSQTAGATLAVQLGGDPSSGKFGQLASSGAATLDGTFAVSLVNGFGPATGRRFDVMTFAGHNGTFSAVTGLSQGRFPLFSLAINPANVELSALANGTDLAFDSFQSATFPANAEPGQVVSVTYTVKNLSEPPAVGSWIDSIYLSRDAVLDPSDTLLTRVEHQGGVAGLGGYTETATAPLPALAEAGYRVLVVVDSRGLASDANRGNNTGVSAQAIRVTVPLLTLATPVNGTLAPGQDRYFRVVVAPAADVTLAADFAALPGAEVSVRYAAVPDETNRDDDAPAGQLHPRLLLSNVQGGTYYIRLHGAEDAVGVAFTLTAAASRFEIMSVSPLKGSNKYIPPAIITLQGAHFTPQTQVQIRQAGGLTRAAQAVEFINENMLVAKFDLLDLPNGAYEVVAADAGQTAVAFDAFTVTNKDSGVTEAWISALAFIKVGAVITLKLYYHNSSDNPLPAPLVEIRATDVGDPGGDETTGALTIDSLPGYLPAGYFHEINPFKTYGTSPKLPGTSTFSLFIIEPSQTPMNWDSQKATLRPDAIPPDAWDAVWDNLRPQLGETLSDFYQFLEITALKLREASGELVEKIDRLFNFELQKANNLPAVPVPATAVDIAFPAPGLPLVFGRSMGDTIAGRYQLGRLGRGWRDNFDISIREYAVTHLVTISQGGGVRYFKLQPDGSFRGAVGEFATLTKVNGAFQLRETTGGVTAFRADGLVNFIEDTNGNRITAGYTGSELTSLTHSNGAALTLSYTGARLHQVTGPAGGVATYEYDASGEHLLRVTTTAGTTEYAYTPDTNGTRAHALASITFLDGTHLFFDYDSHGRLVRQQGDGGAETERFGYDTASYTVTDAQNHATTFFYDDSLRIRRVVDAIGGISTIQYDASNHPVIIGASGGGERHLGYDALGNATSSVNPIGESQTISYEPSHNRLDSFQDALGNAIRFGNDVHGNRVTTTYVDGSTQRYGYGAQGNVDTSVNRLGQVIRFTYNSSGQVIRKDLPDGTHVDYSYNARANLETVVDASGTTRLDYFDPQNQDLLTKIIYPTGRFLEYTYQNGRRTRMVDQSGFAVNYSYDFAGRLDVLRDASGSLIVDYDYDTVGQLARETHGNSTVTEYTYDSAREVTKILDRAPNGGIQSQLVYTYDNLGRRTSVTADDAVTTYGYDGVGRLTTVTLPTGRVITYDYDAAGNRIASSDNGATTNYAVNNLNEYIAFGSTNQTFDAAGNLVSSSNPAGNTSYRYDVEGRLVSQITPTGTWAYEYDALGDRIASTHDGVRTQYLIDPSGLGNVVGEYDGAGNLLAHYTQGFGLTSRVDAAGQAAYYSFDATGNTTELTGATGAVLNSYTYLPFGEALRATETVANPFTYVGQLGVMRDGSGLDFMRNRWYAPVQGRFTQPDPIGLAGGTNLYAYVGNDPVSLVDPSGLQVPPGGAPSGGVFFPENTGELGLPKGATDPGFTQAEQAEWEAYFAADAPGTQAPFVSQNPTMEMEYAELHGRMGLNQGPKGGGLAGAGALTAVAVGLEVGGNAFSQLAYFRRTGEMAPCVDKVAIIPGVVDIDLPHALQACQDPGSTVLDKILDGLFFAEEIAVQRVPPGSIDPNDIVGPAGFGADEFVVPQVTLPYLVNFQNLPAATGPAAEIVVTHVLDADLDLDTFQLEDFGFGDLTFPVPAGRQSYSTRLDLRSTRGVFVDVTAQLDRATHTVTWRLQAIDPETLDLPISPFFGFLPPDKIAPEGEGFVSFSARPKADLTTGTRIDAQATIVFDTNAPIDTNVWTNTIDIGPPTSTVHPLPAVTNSTNFPVSWSGDDDDGTAGSGIASFDVFVSDNGSLFVPWLHDTTENSATYPGELDHTYRFYSVARDNVGHVQPAPETAQAETTVDNTPPVLADMPLDQTIEATMPAGAVATFTMPTASDNLDPNPIVSCNVVSGSTFALGTTAVICSARDDAGNSSSKSFTITVRDTTPPVLALPDDIAAEATGPAGVVGTFSATASDLVDGSLGVSCSPASGSSFGVASTTVNCSATDAHGNIAGGNFTVTVRDTTPPVLTLPGDIAAEATGPAGAAVDYAASSNDLVDGAVEVHCDPAAGSTFALGTISVNCSAADSLGNVAADSFHVTVRDSTAPTLIGLPQDRTVEAPSATGAAVTFTPPTAVDAVDLAPMASCDHVSGSTFALGTTTVTCTASDAAGNSRNGSFHVTVQDSIAPTITGVEFIVKHVGKKLSATGLRVSASEPLEQGPAGQPGNYHLFTAGKDKRFGTPDDVPVRWQSAELDATQRIITLTTEQAMKFNQFYELIVSDALMDMASNRLHGAGSSVPGVGHVATLGAGTKLGFVDSSGDAVSLALKGGGFMQLSLAATGDAAVLELEDTVAGRSVLSGSVNKPKRGTSDGITRIQSMTVAQGAKFRSTLRKPPFSIGPLAQSAIDDLLLASGGTLASVLVSA